MKRILVIILFFTYTFAWAQKNEYRYFSFRIGTVANYIWTAKPNDYLLQRTPYGDMFQTPVNYVNFTLGGEFDLLFHFDAKNDKFGLVTGGAIKNYGISIKYNSSDENFWVVDQYRATAIVIPFYVKFNPAGIYLNQAYMTFGLKYYLNLFVYNIQDGSWTAKNYVRALSGDEFRRQSTSLYFGFNYNIYYMDFEYQLRSLLNKNYRTLTEEGVVMPYQNLDFKSNIFVSMGVHIPLTRWITMRSWTAEKIRRFFSPVR